MQQIQPPKRGRSNCIQVQGAFAVNGLKKFPILSFTLFYFFFLFFLLPLLLFLFYQKQSSAPPSLSCCDVIFRIFRVRWPSLVRFCRALRGGLALNSLLEFFFKIYVSYRFPFCGGLGKFFAFYFFAPQHMFCAFYSFVQFAPFVKFILLFWIFCYQTRLAVWIEDYRRNNETSINKVSTCVPLPHNLLSWADVLCDMISRAFWSCHMLFSIEKVCLCVIKWEMGWDRWDK